MIIIETPAPPTRERLVLVPADAVSRTASEPALNVHSSAGRDATPADLARGGYVRDGDTRAGLREALRARERAELDALAELDEQRARAEKAEGLLIQRETELRLAREDGDERARDLRQAYERAMAAAEKAERERDEAKAGHNAVQPRVYALEADLAETVHERDTLRAELARLTAPGEGSEGEPTYEALGEHYRNAWDASEAMLEMGRRHDAYAALYRLGVAHERARSVTPVSSTPVSSGRATDEELVTIGHAAGKSQAFDGVPEGRGNTWEAWRKECDLAIVRAVAARVRQECLVALAVARGWYIYLCPQKNDPSKWDIETGRVIAGRSDGGAILHGVPASDVPATLARLLGEVGRG